MKFVIHETRQYKKSYKKIFRSGKYKPKEIETVIDMVATGKELPVKYQDHRLKGELGHLRECHVRPNLLLVYRILENELLLILVDIGNHSSLFEK